ncbi:MAG TPA: DUF4405 domain-containing protein [archaeon]|mgnify:CR=1 FL=1|jgi:uncharacterized membrane protein|nr:DUF4405 domain-containing protein [archaeon]
MEKVWINYFIDVGLLISGLIVMISGILKLPLLNFLQLHKITNIPMMSFVHDWSGVLFTILVIVHLILHWNWLVCMTKKLFQKKEKC